MVIKMKLYFLLLFNFLINFSVFSIDMIEKKAVLAGSNTGDFVFARYWNMLSSFQNKTVIYINRDYYIDIETLEFVQYFTPPDQYDYLIAIRPPYSNNIMPFSSWSDTEWANTLVNIETHERTPMPADAGYNFIYFDSDRRYNTDFVFTPEYLITVESGWRFWYVGKDHKVVDAESYYDASIGDIRNNNKIEALLLSEFKGTIFDTPYWLDTFTNLLSSTNIITKYQLSFSWDAEYWSKNDEYNRTYYTQSYLLQKIGSYFDIDVTNLFNSVYKIDIYENGFYAYNTDKIIVFDVKNNSVTSYDIRDYHIHPFHPNIDIILSDFHPFQIRIHQNYFFLLLREFDEYKWESGDTLKVYKLSMD